MLSSLIRKSTDYRPLSATRGLSQICTSFIVFMSQGIHHKLLVTYNKSLKLIVNYELN